MIEKNLQIILNTIVDAKSVGIAINPGTDDEAVITPNDTDATLRADIVAVIIDAISRNLYNIHPESATQRPTPEKLTIKEYRVEDNSRITLSRNELNIERLRLRAVQAVSGRVMASYYQGAIDTLTELLSIIKRDV